MSVSEVVAIVVYGPPPVSLAANLVAVAGVGSPATASQASSMPAGEADPTCRPAGTAGDVVSLLGLTVSEPAWSGE